MKKKFPSPLVALIALGFLLAKSSAEAAPFLLLHERTVLKDITIVVDDQNKVEADQQAVLNTCGLHEKSLFMVAQDLPAFSTQLEVNFDNFDMTYVLDFAYNLDPTSER